MVPELHVHVSVRNLTVTPAPLDLTVTNVVRNPSLRGHGCHRDFLRRFGTLPTARRLIFQRYNRHPRRHHRGHCGKPGWDLYGSADIGTLQSTNYAINFIGGTATLDITKAHLTVSATEVSRYYNLLDPPLYEITGFVNGENGHYCRHQRHADHHLRHGFLQRHQHYVGIIRLPSRSPVELPRPTTTFSSARIAAR